MKVKILSLFLVFGITSQEVFPLNVKRTVEYKGIRKGEFPLTVYDALELKLTTEMKTFTSTKALEASMVSSGFTKNNIITFAQYAKNTRERFGYNTWLYLSMVEHFNDTSLSLFDAVVKMSVSSDTMMYNMPSVTAVSNDNFTKGKIRTNLRFVRSVINEIISLRDSIHNGGCIHNNMLDCFVKFVGGKISDDITNICSDTHMFGFDHRILQLSFQEMSSAFLELASLREYQELYKQKVDDLFWCAERFLLSCGRNDCDFTDVLYDILNKLVRNNIFVSHQD